MPKENETASAKAEARRQAREARASALAQMWLAGCVINDAPMEKTDADYCVQMIADQALDRFEGIAEKVAQRIRDGDLGSGIAQRIRDGASLGSDAAFQALVDDVMLGGVGALGGDEFAVVEAMVTCKLTGRIARYE